MSKRKSNRKGRVPAHQSDVSTEASQGRGTARGDWIYGRHAAMAALTNPNREIHRILASAGLVDELRDFSAGEDGLEGLPPPEMVDRNQIEGVLPQGAVHQGIAVLAAPLPALAVEDICDACQDAPRAVVLVLDQASDPRNVGAVLRSAAAFGAAAVVTQDRNAPDATATLAKAASGALEIVPLVQAINLSRALATLKDAGFWCLGLDGAAKTNIAEADLSGKIALVLGAEGSGLRRLVRDNCDNLARIPIAPGMESLNLSNAAAVALYEFQRNSGGLPDGG